MSIRRTRNTPQNVISITGAARSNFAFPAGLIEQLKDKGYPYTGVKFQGSEWKVRFTLFYWFQSDAKERLLMFSNKPGSLRHALAITQNRPKDLTSRGQGPTKVDEEAYWQLADTKTGEEETIWTFRKYVPELTMLPDSTPTAEGAPAATPRAKSKIDLYAGFDELSDCQRRLEAMVAEQIAGLREELQEAQLEIRNFQTDMENANNRILMLEQNQSKPHVSVELEAPATSKNYAGTKILLGGYHAQQLGRIQEAGKRHLPGAELREVNLDSLDRCHGDLLVLEKSHVGEAVRKRCERGGLNYIVCPHNGDVVCDAIKRYLRGSKAA